MNWNARVDKSNRVTLPKVMREELGLRPGDEFDYQFENRKVFFIRRSDSLKIEFFVSAEAA
jgi:AbrB family looped-hinge helix DNA binding protein